MTHADSDWITSRATPRSVALETTLLAHGVPDADAPALAGDLADAVRGEGADPTVVGVLEGRAIAGLNNDELRALLDADSVKVNTSNLGAALHKGLTGATTVSATMEIAAGAGVRVFATGGIGGVHRVASGRLDVSTDLIALSRLPVAVVSSGVKSILDVASTREALETLGVPVVGFETDDFPAFYQRRSDASGVDVRFDDVDDLARFLDAELKRSGRGVLVCNPIPQEDEISAAQWQGWLDEAEERTVHAIGRAATPAMLDALHTVSEGATLRANIALVLSNARLAGRLAVRMDESA